MYGKILGGILGLFFGGIYGIIGGMFLGHFFIDEPRAMREKERNRRYSSRKSAARSLLFLELFCHASAKIAKAKGFVSKDDIESLEAIFKELNLTSEARRHAIKFFREGKVSSRSISNVSASFARHFPSSNDRFSFLGGLVKIALSDEQFDTAEINLLYEAAIALGFSPNIVNSFVNEYERSKNARSHQNNYYSRAPRRDSRLDDAYKTLGVYSDASMDEIKKVYRSKCKKFHPDIHRSKGLSEDAIKALEKELAKINDAYDIIQKARA